MQNASSAMKFRNQMFYGISQICHDLAGEVKLETESKLIIDKSMSVSPKHQISTAAWASGVKSNLQYLDTCHVKINAFLTEVKRGCSLMIEVFEI
ncbi:hypothetical protein D5086_013490 [Populus alba]|uniref:Uncharacterized protein n=2 Tax=Populus TaxID=3689 RepID=A0ACC4C6N5_POPAL